MLAVSSRSMDDLPFPMLKSSSAILSRNAFFVLSYLLDIQLVTCAPEPATEPTQQEVRNPNERLSPTLPWSAKPIDAIVPSSRSTQQPIAPTKKKERPSARPSCRKEAGMKHVQVASPPNDQNVEMTDVLVINQ